MITHIIKKIKANYQIIVFQYLYIFVTILVVFLLLGFRDAAVNKIDSKIVFFEESFIVNSDVTNQYYPKGFKLTNNHIQTIKDQFQFVTLAKSVSMDISLTQHVSFTAISDDFLETGVPFQDRVTSKTVVQKVTKIYGELWDMDSTKPVVIVDDKTAELLFGYKNVVGKKVPTIYGDLEIIAVVTSTNERSQLIAQAIKSGQAIDETMYSTNAYISYGYLSTLANVETHNSTLVVRDTNMSMDHLKRSIKDTLGIPMGDNSIITSRQDIIDREITSRKTFFQIIVSLTSVFAFLGIINLINVSIFSYRINKKTIGIYKIVGYSNKMLLYISIVEGLILGLGSSLVSIVTGFIILLIGTLISATFSFLSFANLFIISLILILIFTFIVLLINFLTTLFSINRNTLYYLKGE